MGEARRTYFSTKGITRLLLLGAVFASTFTSTEIASSAQLYKVRIGEIGKTDLFFVGHKAFKYTERGYNSYYGANLYLIPCVKTEDSDCIESLSYRVSNSQEWKKAELDSSWKIPANGVPMGGSDKGSPSATFVIKNLVATPSDPENNYPASGATSIWKVSQTGHDSNFRLYLNFNLSGTNPDPKSEKILWKEFTTQVLPISGYFPHSAGIPSGRADNSFGNISGLKVKVRVGILKQILNGWVHSRTTNPEISYGVDTASGEFVDFSGTPLSVPTAEAVMDETQYLAAWEKPYMKSYLKQWGLRLSDLTVNPGGGGMWASTSGIEQGELKMWSAYEPYWSKTAASRSSLWKISGEGNLNLQKFNSSECVSQGKIDGILATNATQYSPTPPIFDESTQELSYQLAAPHFKDANEEFKGTYSLVISEKLAHCIWGKSLTNASARVSILNSDGKSSVVSQSLNKRSGFYYFDVNGFGFSAPTIRIKLIQDAVVDSPTPKIAIASPKKMVTITCVKGKLSKKVTALKPACPTGYKKK
jgi:hypothetical protein